MSGTSRIGGYGSRDSGGRESRSASLLRFCRGRKVGDVVRGVFVRREAESLGWALLEGEELLAHLPGGMVPPREGEEVFFRIDSLHPEVVLRMLSSEGPAARLASLAPSLPLAQEAALYTAARDRLDSLLAALPEPVAQPFPFDMAARKAAFVTTLAANAVCFAAFAETLLRSRALHRAGQPAGLIFLQHMPWLSRAVTGIEVSLWKGDVPVLAGATLPSGDRLVVHGTGSGGVFRYRTVIISALGGEARPLSPQGPERGGRENLDVVGQILAQAALSATVPVGRFSRRL